MPTYDYVCDGCGHKFDEMQSFKDDPLKTCPKCHEDRLRRLLGTGAAILFKGSGFYITDYRSDSYQSAAKADAEAAKPASDGKAATNGTTGASSNGASSSGASKGDSAKSST